MILNNILKNSSQKFNSKTALTMQMGFRIKNLSYLEVYNLAKQVSVFLGNNNINYQDKVLLCAPNSPYWIIVFWGCLLRGAILVPLNIQSTSDVINAIIKETKSKILFKNGSFKQNILDKNIKSFNTEFLLEYLENTNINNYKETKITPEDLVQIMYTSGTTGSPKGVMLSHKNILSNVQSVNKAISMSSRQDKLLSILPLSHIYEQTIGFLLPYSMGVQIIYAHSHLEIRNLLKKYKITRMLAVPEFLQLFISRIELGFTEKNKLKLFNKLLKFSKKLNSKFLSRILFYFILKKFGGKLHTIASGGAALDPALEEKWEALGVTILQGYGLTETSPVISTNTYKDHKLGSVGKPISEVKVKLSKNKEILVSGPNVFSGYYQNLEKTREVLSSDGWFNTEDLGEIDKDGFLFIKGRKKYLILGPGGQNVYPEDIEFQLNKSSKVLESCVVGIDHTNSATQIQAAVIPAKDIKLTDKDLEDILSNTNNKLVSYQHLNKIVVWPEPEFPKTATRKVKKPLITEFLTNIKNNVHNQDLNKKNNTNSRPEFEKLAKILAIVTNTNIKDIDLNTVLTRDLSLDSLARVELVSELELEYKLDIPEEKITEKTTVKDLLNILKEKLPLKKKYKLTRWARNPIATSIRFLLQPLFFLLPKPWIKTKVSGLENLKNINTPILLLPNHLTDIDAGLILEKLPIKLRLSTAIAAARDSLYEPFWFVAWLIEIVVNTFPIQRTGGNIKDTLEHIGQVLDLDYSVMLFPEGKITKTGDLSPLKQGAGVSAIAMGVPVVPIKISKNLQKVIPYNKYIPAYLPFFKPREIVEIKIGKPLKFKQSDSYIMATEQIEKALKAL